MHTYSIIAYNGGECLSLADTPIYFPINDMQVAEDAQLIVGHLCMKWLNMKK